MNTAPPCLEPYSVIHGCPRATPTGRWLKSEGHFCHTFKPRACLARRSCATQASYFWSLACWSEKDAIRLRATNSLVAPGAGRKVNGGETGPEPSSGRYCAVNAIHLLSGDQSGSVGLGMPLVPMICIAPPEGETLQSVMGYVYRVEE